MNPKNIAARVGVEEETFLCVIEEQVSYPNAKEEKSYAETHSSSVWLWLQSVL